MSKRKIPAGSTITDIHRGRCRHSETIYATLDYIIGVLEESDFVDVEKSS